MNLHLPLAGIAASLSGITAALVGMTVFDLVVDPVRAVMFAGAAVLLDAYKYLAWPVARQLIGDGRGALGILMVVCSVALAGVSGWATYDRLGGSLASRGAASDVSVQNRIKDVEEARTSDLRRLQALEEDSQLVRRQVTTLTDLGRVSKAADLGAAGKGRLDAERQEVMGRLDSASRELADLRSKPAPTRLVDLLLCVGFALALELVPVIIFLSAPRRRQEVVEAPVPETVPALEPEPEPLYDAVLVQMTPAEEVPQLQPKPDPEPALAEKIRLDLTEPKEQIPEPTQPHMREPVPGRELSPEDETLLQSLLRTLTGVEPGTSVPIKPFARSVSIGNPRAGDIFKVAEARGHLVKTNRGYVAA